MGEIRIPLSPGFHAQPGETPGHLHDIYTTVPPLGGNRRIHVGTLSKAAVEAWAIAEDERIQALGRLAGARTAITAGASQMTRPVTPITTERGDAEGRPLERVRHLKRGFEYEVLGEAEAQVAVGDPLVFPHADIQTLRDGDMLTVYRCLKTGKLWIRLTEEFRDGRFETIAAASHPGEADRVGLGELERLSAEASPGMAIAYMDKFRLRVGPEDSTFVGEHVTVAVTSTCDKAHANLVFLAELWNAYRSGKLVHASNATLSDAALGTVSISSPGKGEV